MAILYIFGRTQTVQSNNTVLIILLSLDFSLFTDQRAKKMINVVLTAFLICTVTHKTGAYTVG